MKRRAFLQLLAAGFGAAVGRTYFDLGEAWKKNEAGLLVPNCEIIEQGQTFCVTYEHPDWVYRFHQPTFIYLDGLISRSIL